MSKAPELTKAELLLTLRMPVGIRGTYLLWRLGIDPKYTIARDTYQRHRETLLQRWKIDITTPYQ